MANGAGLSGKSGIFLLGAVALGLIGGGIWYAGQVPTLDPVMAGAGDSRAETPAPRVDSTPRADSAAAGDSAPRVSPTPDPQTAATAPPGPITPPGLAAPAFDVVRVEPDGSAVIAGTAAPGANVTLLLDAREIGTARADAGGKFAAFLSLEPGDTPRVLSLLAALDGTQVASDDQIILAPFAAPAPQLAEAQVPAEPQPPAAGTTSVEAPQPQTAEAQTPTEPEPPVAQAAPAVDPEPQIADARPLAELEAPTASPQPPADPEPQVAETEVPAKPLAEAAAPQTPAEPAPRAAETTATADPQAQIAEAPTTAQPEPQGTPAAPTGDPIPQVAEANTAKAQAQTPAAPQDTETLQTATEEPQDTETLQTATAEPQDAETLQTATAEPQDAKPPQTATAAPQGAETTQAAPAREGIDTAETAAPEPQETEIAAPETQLAEAQALSQPAPQPADTGPAPSSATPPQSVAPAPRLSTRPVAALTDEPGLAPAPSGPAAPATTGGSAAPASAPAPVPAPGAVAILRAGRDGIELLQPATPRRPEAMARIALDTIGYSARGEVQLSGRAKGRSVVRVYLDNKPVADLDAAEDGRWSGQLDGVAPGIYTLRLDELGGGGKVLSRLETPFKRESPEVLNPPAHDSAPDHQPLVQAVTVQKGDTLWAISRSRYGDGLLYVRVFQANSDAIRNPDLIYPGQVFSLPD